MRKKKTQILFRTAGGRAKGKQLAMGHIYRCINLAKNLKPNTIHFLLEDFGGAEQVVRNNGFSRITLIRPGINCTDDISQTITYIKKNKIDIIVVDHLYLKDNFLRKIQKFAKTVVITDLYKKDLHADLLVNGFIGYSNKVIKNRFSVKCLLGPKYQIINDNFTNKQRVQKKYDLLLTFGGFDERGIADMMVEPLIEYLPKLKTKIIIGSVASKSKRLQHIKQKPVKNITIINSSKNMHYEIANSRFGICTGGITTYEFAASKIPFAIICDDKHQLVTAREWQKRKMAVNFGMVDKKMQKKISIFLSKIANNRIRLKTNNLVDGYGARRVSHEILKMV